MTQFRSFIFKSTPPPIKKLFQLGLAVSCFLAGWCHPSALTKETSFLKKRFGQSQLMFVRQSRTDMTHVQETLDLPIYRNPQHSRHSRNDGVH